MDEVFVSIVMPVYNEEKYIVNCIDSLLQQDYSQNLMEWIFVDGMSTDNTKQLIQQYIEKYPTLIKVYDNPNKTVPYAMNIGIGNAKGKYIIRLDAHADYSKNYISKCVYYLNTTNADNVGGIAETKSRGIVGNAIAKMLSSKFGVGNSQFRTNGESGYVDTVPFGAFRREVFEKYGGYDERLTRNQDNEMNYRIRKNGGNVIGYDLNAEKIKLYKNGVDPTNEVGNEGIKNTTVEFTADETKIREAKFIIVAVPTPVNTDHTPDLTPVIGASEIVGRNLTRGAIVVYESTVYPGCTEDVCIPILEKESGMKCGVDFKVGYSPERINPGDKVHRLENIHKIVSGMDEESLKEIKNIYDLVIEVGTHPVSNIKTAEAVKVVENSQRDINIAFMNELAMVFDRMGIDTNEVVNGMNTKWNALGFRPGLVGGHCIGVDPYYFTYEAEKLGYHSQIILNGRIVNDSMGAYIANAAVKQMIAAGQAPRDSKVVILGLTFKENCPDTRNSKVDDIIKQLKTYDITPVVIDPWANESDALREYGVELKSMAEARDADCVIVAVAHNEFKAMSLSDIKGLFRKSADAEKVLLDVKGLYKIDELKASGMRWWRL